MQRAIISRAAAVTALLAAVTSVSTSCASEIREMHVDGPTYSSVDAIIGAAQFAFVVEVQESKGVMAPPEYEGEDPRENPLAGTGRTPTEQELHDAATPMTQHTVAVVDPLSAPFETGDHTSVYQLGGEVDGRQYQIEGMQQLEVGQKYLLFIFAGSSESMYTMVGVNDGVFVADQTGEFVNSASLTIPDEEVNELRSSEIFSDGTHRD